MPQGIANEEKYFFNNEDIDKIIFEGIIDETTTKFLQGVEKWTTNTNFKQGESGLEITDN